MGTVSPHSAGLDVHRDTVAARVRHHDGGRRPRQEVRALATHTRALEELAAWLSAEGVTRAAMEATGVYRKPVYNVLDGRATIPPVNAQHIKPAPGRKADAADCARIARLLRRGLLTASFVPPARRRERRDLTRQRAQLGAGQTAVANRLRKGLGDANVKLASVASDALGVSGRATREAGIAGRGGPDAPAARARRRMRGEIPELRPALRGRVTDHRRFPLRLLLDHFDRLGGLVARLDARIEPLTAPDAEALARLTAIPGIERHTAEVLVAEVGPTADPLPTAGRFASWAGGCPGNNEGAGKRRTGRTTKGNRRLRQAVVQAGWAAAHSQTTYLGARYRRWGPAARGEAGADGGRTHPPGDRVPGAGKAGGVPGTGGG